MSTLEYKTQAVNRHCGLDPQSPEQNGESFAFRRWRMFIRHDGKGVSVVNAIKSMVLLAWLFSLMSSAWAQETVEVVRAFTNRKAIVVEYDLAMDADFVRLFVSFDGGNTYRGPMQQVSGDIADVKAGFSRNIVWDVLKELDMDEFNNENVRFKLNILLKERWPQETFVTLNASYSPAPQCSFGFSVGQVKRFGWFVSVMSNGNFSGFHPDGICNGQGFLPDAHLMQYTGETSKMRLSVMAGGMMRIKGPWMARVGVGYGNRALLWQTTDGQWLRNTAYSLQGIDFSAGLQLHLKGFAMSLEAVTTQFQNVEAKIGLGYAF